jgi:CheY-like chemotaxis protein
MVVSVARTQGWVLTPRSSYTPDVDADVLVIDERESVRLLRPHVRLVRGEAAAERGEVALPVAPEALAVALTGFSAPASAARAPTRALLVDDNAVNLLVASQILERAGFEVEQASSGEDALRAARTGAFDVVLMDLYMPGLDGFEATRALRREGFSGPVLAITGSAETDLQARCLAAGMVGVLYKPVHPSELVAAIHRVVEGEAPDASAVGEP